MSAVYYDDLPVGYESLVGEYSLGADEVIEFARRWDPQPFHIDEAAARDSISSSSSTGRCRTGW